MAEGGKDKSQMPFLDHLEELRWRIIKSLAAVGITAFICFYLSGNLLEILIRPTRFFEPSPELIYLSPFGMFIVRINVSIVAGIILSLPVIFYQTCVFVAPGLLEHERRYIPYVIGLSVLCFILGAMMAYFVVAPLAIGFMVRMGTPDIIARWDVGKYIGMLLRLVIAFGIIFELPVASYFLSRLGIIGPQSMKKNRRYAVILIFILSAILTPPDVISQLFMALPLILLYEVSILLAYRAQKTKI